MSEIAVLIPDGINPSNVTLEMSPDAERLIANGARIRVLKGIHDITDYLNIPEADSNGVIDFSQADVRQAIADEAMDPTRGTAFVVGVDGPVLTTAPTKPGLTYTLVEGAALEAMTDGASKQGDGKPWTPAITVKGGRSGFYRIKVGK